MSDSDVPNQSSANGAAGPAQPMDNQQSIHLLHELEQRLAELRSWEQSHGQLVEQLRQRASGGDTEKAARADQPQASPTVAKPAATVSQQASPAPPPSKPADDGLAKRQSRVEEAERRLAETNAELEKQRQGLERQRQELAQQQEKVQKLNEDVERKKQLLQQEVAKHREQLLQKQRELASLQLQLQKHDQLISQQREEIEKEHREIAELHQELERKKDAVSTQQQVAVRLRCELTEQHEQLEKQQSEVAGQQEQRNLLEDVRQCLKDSEDEMVRRWARDRTLTTLTRAAMIFVALVALSYAASWRLQAYYRAMYIGDAELELAGLLFCGGLGGLIVVGVPLWWLRRRRKRVLDEPENRAVLDQLDP